MVTPTRAPAVLATVPRLWPSATIVCLATGPSLTVADAELARRLGPVVCVNDAWKLAPWADVLYAADAKWWRHHGKALVPFTGLRFSVEPSAQAYGAQVLRHTGGVGLDRHPTRIRTGKNSGYQAINLAVHLGAARIVLLGYDCQRTGGQDHFFGSHPKPLTQTSDGMFREWRTLFASLVAPLAELKIEIVNASRETALTCFPRRSLEQLTERAA